MNPLPLALWESVYRQRVARERVGTDRPPVPNTPWKPNRHTMRTQRFTAFDTDARSWISNGPNSAPSKTR
jgi:hypothetical protein